MGRSEREVVAQSAGLGGPADRFVAYACALQSASEARTWAASRSPVIENTRSRMKQRIVLHRAIAVWFFACFLVCQSAGANGVGAGERAFARGDYLRAARLLLVEARSGRRVAQTYLGHLYENGWGVPQNYEEAAKWFLLAAEKGDPTAQFLLGRLYDNGSGVKQDFVEAEFWLDLAAAKATPRDRDYWINMRDAVAGKLTRDELTRARARALAWSSAQAR